MGGQIRGRGLIHKFGFARPGGGGAALAPPGPLAAPPPRSPLCAHKAELALYPFD